jgi:ubiquinone/menaquinone biosynthesis C-methylase UbiE
LKENNLWQNKLVAFAYRWQKEARPYREMLETISNFIMEVKSGSKILDIGTGSGRLIDLTLEKSTDVSSLSIIGLDISNDVISFTKKRFRKNNNIDFLRHDISNESLPFPDNHFNLVTAGLSLQYAQYWDQKNNCWSDTSYREIYQDIFRVLKSGGKLIFSVNTPDPDFSIIAKKSWREIFLSWRLPLFLIVSIIMVSQGRWLTKESRIGRFHYWPIEKIVPLLKEKGFANIEYKLTYAGLAYVIKCEKP